MSPKFSSSYKVPLTWAQADLIRPRSLCQGVKSAYALGCEGWEGRASIYPPAEAQHLAWEGVEGGKGWGERIPATSFAEHPGCEGGRAEQMTSKWTRPLQSELHQGKRDVLRFSKVLTTWSQKHIKVLKTIGDFSQ